MNRFYRQLKLIILMKSIFFKKINESIINKSNYPNGNLQRNISKITESGCG